MVSAHSSPDCQVGMFLFRKCTKTRVHPPNRSDLLKCLLWTWDGALLQHTWCLLLLFGCPLQEHNFFLASSLPFTTPPPLWMCSTFWDRTAPSSSCIYPLRGVSPPSEPFLCHRMAKHLLCSITRTVRMWTILLSTARGYRPLISSSVVIRDHPLLPQHLYFFGNEVRSPRFEAVPLCVRLGMTPPSFLMAQRHSKGI